MLNSTSPYEFKGVERIYISFKKNVIDMVKLTNGVNMC